VPARSYYNSRPGSYIMPQQLHCALGPDRWSQDGYKPIIVLGFLWSGITNDGLGDTWSAPSLVALPHYAWSAARLWSVASHGTVVVPYEWATWPVLHYSHLSTRLIGIKYTVCLHVLQAHDSPDALETCARVLRTCKPSCTSKTARFFFMFKFRGP
jgi:hypothetical protein